MDIGIWTGPSPSLRRGSSSPMPVCWGVGAKVRGKGIVKQRGGSIAVQGEAAGGTPCSRLAGVFFCGFEVGRGVASWAVSDQVCDLVVVTSVAHSRCKVISLSVWNALPCGLLWE